MAPNRLREARKAAGLSQVALAAAIGVHHPHVSRWETGHVEPRVGMALRLAAACGTTVEAIWGRNEKRPGGVDTPPAMTTSGGPDAVQEA